MGEAINKALKHSIADGKIRYVFATYAKIVISFQPAPFNRHCFKCNPDGTVLEVC